MRWINILEELCNTSLLVLFIFSTIKLQVWSIWTKSDIPIWHLCDWLMERFSSQLSSQFPNLEKEVFFFLIHPEEFPLKFSQCTHRICTIIASILVYRLPFLAINILNAWINLLFLLHWLIPNGQSSLINKWKIFHIFSAPFWVLSE